MKQQINRIFSLCLALLLCVGLFALPVSAEELSGSCGENLTWKLELGVLTISGKGAMWEYSEFDPAPWLTSADLIQRVVVEDGVTTIAPTAFYHCENLTAVLLPASVISLGELAFSGCTKLTQISLPGVQTIGSNCFNHCNSLVNLILPEGLKSIGDQAFYRCSRLGGITVPNSVEELGHSVFAYCNNLVYANIQAPITVLPNWTFYSCDLLWQLYLPGTITTVEHNAIGQCDSLYYVDYNGSQEVKQELQQQMDATEQTDNEPIQSEVTFNQTENAVITTVTTVQVGIADWIDDDLLGTVIHATITDQPGWQELIEVVEKTETRGETPTIQVELTNDVEVNEDVLLEFAETGATVTVLTPDNVSWEVILDDQTSDSLGGQQDFSVSMVKNQPGTYADILGDAVSYTVTLSGTTLNTTIKLPLGRDAARQVATLYSVKNRTLNKLSSVIIDDDGMAAFCVAGTAAGEYILAINVQGIPQQEVNIPQALAPSYNIDYSQSTLTDSQGNQYIITGTRNDIGFGLGTLTLIVVGVLVGSVVVVGAIMITWNKSKQKAMPNRKKRS